MGFTWRILVFLCRLALPRHRDLENSNFPMPAQKSLASHFANFPLSDASSPNFCLGSTRIWRIWLFLVPASHKNRHEKMENRSISRVCLISRIGIIKMQVFIYYRKLFEKKINYNTSIHSCILSL